MKEHMQKMKSFWLTYEQKIVIAVIFCLIAAISYEFGLLKGQKLQQKPLVIEKPANTPCEGQTATQGDSGAPGGQSTATDPASKVSGTAAAKCAFVGSKNSTKFYAPTCSWAKRIKPENMACYASEQEALARGKTKSDCK